MVPKLHPKGSSFKGCAQYVLHDKDKADTNERVDWAETRNLATDDPDMAWRIMAATAMDQNRLKAEAGVKNTGRKSDKHVLHLTLNWHPEQKPSRQDMMQAADEALKALGAEDRQALIVAHNDTPHKHLHIVVNRVSSEDGRHLSSSKEKLKLSQWAQAYEERGGQIYCENRVVNNGQRDKGEYTRGDQSTARHIFEQQRDNIANDNDSGDTKRRQQVKDHALAQRGRVLAAMQKAEHSKLEDAHQQRKSAIHKNHARAKEKIRKAVLEEMRPALIKLNKDQAKEAETFLAMEKNVFGRIGNAFKSLRVDQSDDVSERPKKGPVSRVFGALANADQRIDQFLDRQKGEKRALERQMDQEVSKRTKPVEDAYRANLAKNRGVLEQERGNIIERHAIQTDALKADWRDRNIERVKAYAAQANQNRDVLADKLAELRKTSPGAAATIDRYLKGNFDNAGTPAREQDNSKDKDDSWER